MHPILTKGRLRLYLAAWIPVGALLAALSAASRARSWSEAIALTLPLALVYAFICLASWSLCRAIPLEATGFGRLAGAHLVGAALSSGLWLLIGSVWAFALARLTDDPPIVRRYMADLPILFAVGVVVFLLVAAVHYLLIAFEASRAAEKRALELQILARDARMKALTAQVNPHFLFNSLNSISALAGSDPAGARRMCLLLADFLRATLRLGARERVTVAEEMALASGFLAVEQVRFGQRLIVDTAVAPGAESCLVPPLLLQPLVENAVSHGIAHMIEPGTVRIEAAVGSGRLRIAVENPCDPDRPESRGHGLGVANVRSRLAALFGPAAKVEIDGRSDHYRIALSLPAETGLPSGAAESGATPAAAQAAAAESSAPPAGAEAAITRAQSDAQPDAQPGAHPGRTIP